MSSNHPTGPAAPPVPPPQARRLAPILALALLLQAGCDREEAGLAKRTMKFEEVPATSLDAAKKQLPDVTFDEAWTNVDREGAVHSYEIRGRAANGKIREVRVTKDGKILEME